MNGVAMNSNVLEDINAEITKSLRSINYSQWERQPKQNLKPSKSRPSTSTQQQTKQHTKSSSNLDAINKKPSLSASNCNNQHKCNHNHSQTKTNEKRVFKTKRQLEEEENRKNVLRIKIKFTKEYLDSLKQREIDLFQSNKKILNLIEKKEKASNLEVDGILRKYEKYQNVKNTIKKKHIEEVEEKKHELEKLKFETKIELSINQENLDKLERELDETQQLSKQLSIYKNQEHPEKQLQIANLKKKLQDMNDIHNEEHDSLIDLLNYEKNLLVESQIEKTRQIAERVSSKALIEMHESLKDMANHNQSMKEEIEFFKKLIVNLKDEIALTENDVKELKQDSRRSLRNVLFNDIIIKKEICTPDMDIELDFNK